jgi:hypothetical protein
MGVEFAPKTAGFIPGLGADIDCALGQAFIRQAEAAEVTPVTPPMVDVTENGRITVVPSLDVQAERAQEALDCDLIVVWSAGVLPTHRALQNRELRPEQRIIFLAPSVRHPGTTFDQHALTSDELRDRHGLTFFDYREMDDRASEGGYEPATTILPGTADVGRLIAVSDSYIADVEELYPPQVLAEVINTFAINGLGAWIKMLRRDSRLDKGEDTRLHKKHAELLAIMRSMLVSDVRVEVEVLKGGSLYFNGKEDEVMGDVLFGEFFGRALDKVWMRDNVLEVAAVLG